MQKEVLIAIIFGSVFGLIIAFGIWKTASTFTPVTNEISHIDRIQPTKTPQATPQKQQQFSVTSPNAQSVSSAQTQYITGTANQNSYILVTGEDTDILVKSTDTGAFEAELKLIKGVNQLRVFELNNNQKPLSSDHLVIYSTNITTTTPPSIYIGTVTDIIEGIFQIRSESGTIQQIATAQTTTFANIVKETKEVALKDVAIGDFIYAIGDIQKETLNAQRILISTPLKTSTTTALYGSVTKVTKTDIAVSDGTIIDLKTKPTVLTMNSQNTTKAAKVTDIKVGSSVIVTASSNTQPLPSNTIYVLPQAQ